MQRFNNLTNYTIIYIILCLIIRLFSASQVPISTDEAYYWLWSRSLQPSYYDHPPMVAIWIWIGSHIFPLSAFSIRISCVISNLLTSLIVMDTARRIHKSLEAGMMAGILLNSTLLYFISGFFATPDNPLLLFWSLGLWFFVRFLEDDNKIFLYLTGMATGLCFISKYTGLFLVFAIILNMIIFRRNHHWLRSPHLFGAMFLALLCTTPVIYWNMTHNWASIAKQFNHAFAGSAPVSRLKSMEDFVWSQIGLISPFLFLLFFVASIKNTIHGWQEKNPLIFLAGSIFPFMFVFFLHHSSEGNVQAHWLGPAWITAAIAASGLFARHGRLSSATSGRQSRFSWQKIGFVGIILGNLTILVVLSHAFWGILPVKPSVDPIKRLMGWDILSQDISQKREMLKPGFIFTERHEIAGILSFYLKDHPPVFLRGPMRPSWYDADDLKDIKNRNGLYLTRTKYNDKESIKNSFDRVEFIGRDIISWHGKEIDSFDIYMAYGYKGGLFVAGDGFNGRKD